MKKKAYILFSRLPELGKVKTRLETYFFQETCAFIQEAMLLDLLDECKDLLDDADVFLCWTGSEAVQSFLTKIPSYVETLQQKNGNLGERMYQGIREIMANGYESFVLTGSDVPHLTSKEILGAFEVLDEKQGVIGPTMDGGYYLIGGDIEVAEVLRKECSWGTGKVFQQTCYFLDEKGISYGKEAVLQDVDEPKDFFQCKEGGERYQKLRRELLNETEEK